MSDNYKDNDMERIIFRDALASSEIEPSEKFWNKAFENILLRENRASAYRISKWKGTSFILGTAVVILGSYIIYMHTQVNEIKQQLTKIENTPVNTIQQELKQNNAVANAEIPAVASINKTFPVMGIRRKHTKYIANAAGISAPTAQQTVNITPDANNTQPGISGSSSVVNKETAAETITGTTGSQNVDSISPKTTAIHNSQFTIHNLMDSSSLDSANSLYIPKHPLTLAEILSNSSISIFYAPGMTDDFLNDKNNDPTNAITANELKTRQDGDGTFATGLRLAYDISGKWTIQTGCYYSQYTYNINPAIIYAQQQENGQVGYSITTSSGTVFLPYSAGPAHVGDSIKVKGSSSRGYISIPLQVKYKFATGAKFGFYATGGFSVNIAKYEETEIHWENTSLQEGDVSVQSIYGLNTIQYSYNFGLGATYLIRRGLSIYAEPYLNGSFTSINKNTPVITYPYFFGLALGVTYHL